jgi:uncharacterized protein (TIGR02996 family)
MDTAEALLQAIRAEPEDDLPRLAYADWLDEHGEPERAEFIRTQIERVALEGEVGALERSCHFKSRDQGEFFRGIRAALRGASRRRSTREHTRREARLLKAHGERWLAGLPFPVTFRRGFPELMEMSARRYLEAADILQRVAPVQAVKLTSFATYDVEPEGIDWDEEDRASLELVGRLADCPQLQRWVELELACPGGEIFETILASPHLTQLRRLVATGNEVGPGVAIVVDPRFAHLRWLDLYNSNSANGRPNDDDFIDIVTSPHLARLEFFDFGTNDAGDDGLEALASSATSMTHLRSLGLAGNHITTAGLHSLGHSANLPALRHLDVGWSMSRQMLDDAALAVLLESPLLGRLTFLDFHGNPISDGGVRQLGSTPAAVGLRALVLGGTRFNSLAEGGGWRQILSAASVRALAEAAHLTGLRRLALPDVPLDDELAVLLAGSRRLRRLRELRVDAGPGLTEAGRQALQTRFGKGLVIIEDA